MKKILVLACACVFALALAGCASGGASSSSAASSASSGSAAASSASSSDASASESAASSSAASESAASPSAAAVSSSASADDSSSAASSEPAESGESDQSQTIDWEPVGSAAEAANAAGCKNFDVPGKFSIGDISFENPSFSYADRVAQALYESGATAVYIRKADGIYGAPLSDRNYDEFPNSWTQNHKGLEINCYGPEEDAATLIQWNVGSEAFALTYQGLGGDEMTMTPDDITSIVTAIQ